MLPDEQLAFNGASRHCQDKNVQLASMKKEGTFRLMADYLRNHAEPGRALYVWLGGRYNVS